MLIWKEVWVIVYVIDSFEIHHLLWHLFNRHAHLLPSFLSSSLSLSHYLFFLWNATAHSNRPTAFALRSFTLAPLLLYSRAYKETVAYNSVKKFVSPSTNFTSEQIRSLFPGFSDGFSFSSPLPFPFSLFFFFYISEQKRNVCTRMLRELTRYSSDDKSALKVGCRAATENGEMKDLRARTVKYYWRHSRTLYLPAWTI